MAHRTISNTRKKQGNRTIISTGIRNNILKMVESAEKPVSTQEIGDTIGGAWHSVQMHCLKLQIEGKINGFRVGNMNLWVKAKSKEM